MAENSFQPFTRRQTMIRRDFEIYRYRYMDEVELHHHDFYEIYMLLRGSVSYTVENRIFHMRAGDLMLISPLELHQARVDSNDEPVAPAHQPDPLLCPHGARPYQSAAPARPPQRRDAP